MCKESHNTFLLLSAMRLARGPIKISFSRETTHTLKKVYFSYKISRKISKILKKAIVRLVMHNRGGI